MALTVSRRSLIRLGGVAAAAAAVPGLTGCGDKKEAATPGVPLRMMWWGGDARTKAYQDALAAYGRARGSDPVKAEFSGYDGYFDKLDADVAGGNAADLIQMDTGLVKEYARRQVLRPLDGYLGNQLDLSLFPEALLAAGKVDGKLYGVPSGTGGVLVTYDVTMLRGVGAAPPQADWTWASLAGY